MLNVVGDKSRQLQWMDQETSPLFKGFNVLTCLNACLQVCRDVHNSGEQENEAVHKASKRLRSDVVVGMQHIVNKFIAIIKTLTQLVKLLSLSDTVEQTSSQFGCNNDWLRDDDWWQDVWDDVGKDAVGPIGTSHLNQGVSEVVSSLSVELMFFSFFHLGVSLLPLFDIVPKDVVNATSQTLHHLSQVVSVMLGSSDALDHADCPRGNRHKLLNTLDLALNGWLEDDLLKANKLLQMILLNSGYTPIQMGHISFNSYSLQGAIYELMELSVATTDVGIIIPALGEERKDVTIYSTKIRE